MCIYISYPPILQLRPMVGVCTMHSGALGGFSWGSAARFNERKKERKKSTHIGLLPHGECACTYIHTFVYMTSRLRNVAYLYNWKGGCGWIEDGDDIDAIDLDLHEQKRILKKGKEKKIDGNNPQTAFIDSGLPFLFPFSFCPFCLTPSLPMSSNYLRYHMLIICPALSIQPS